MDSDPPAGQEPRGAHRVAWDVEASLRRSGTHAFRVRVFDASPEGCKIEFVERPSVGERLWIKFDGIEAVEASVRWVAGHVGGLQFTRPFHAAVFERLASRSAKRP